MCHRYITCYRIKFSLACNLKSLHNHKMKSLIRENVLLNEFVELNLYILYICIIIMCFGITSKYISQCLIAIRNFFSIQSNNFPFRNMTNVSRVTNYSNIIYTKINFLKSILPILKNVLRNGWDFWQFSRYMLIIFYFFFNELSRILLRM